MKKINLLILILILPLSCLSQLRDSVYVKTDIYEIMYSEKHEQPLWVKYKLSCQGGKVSRKGLDFYTNDSIKTSDDKDYQNNVWDKGHIAPAKHFNCDPITLKTTFSYLNCALQNETLNRGVWRLVETKERELLKTHSDIWVLVQLDFSSFKKLPTGSSVPKGFYKNIYIGNFLYESYYFLNKPPHTTDLKKFLLEKNKINRE